MSYKMDLELSSGKYGQGMLVLPDKLESKILISAPAKLDVLLFRSCSREMVIEKPSYRLDRSEYLITYKRNEIEQQPACSVDIQVYNKNHVASYGFIDFEDVTATIPALILCGEKEELFNGVSVCQSRVGLLQKIKFNEEVEIETYEGCDKIISIDQTNKGKEFILEATKDYCIYVFKSGLKRHRLTVYGYEDVFIRE